MNWQGTALITGASAGLGVEFARQIARRGVDVVLVARREDRLHQLAGEIRSRTGRKATVLPADLSKPESVDYLTGEIASRRIVVDYLVNNAGGGSFGSAVDLGVERAREIMRLNMEAPTALSLAFGKQMAERGHGAILNVASTAGYQPIPYFNVYSASKAYLISFSESLSAELVDRGVRVMTICPGATDSEFGQAAGVGDLMRAASLFSATADGCVRRSLDAFERGAITYIDGPLNIVGAAFGRVAPRNLLTRTVAAFAAPVFGSRAKM